MLPVPAISAVEVGSATAVSSPKMVAPLMRDLGLLEPTGGQERGYRAGTENLPGALGFAAALEASRDWFDAMPDLRDELDAAVIAGGGEIVAADAPRIPTIAAYRMPGVSSAAQLIRCDMAGFAVSAGSACSSGKTKASHVLQAMQVPQAIAERVVRVSFGPDTSEQQVDHFALAWEALDREARARAA